MTAYGRNVAPLRPPPLSSPLPLHSSRVCITSSGSIMQLAVLLLPGPPVALDALTVSFMQPPQTHAHWHTLVLSPLLVSSSPFCSPRKSRAARLLS